ncbi:MAG: FAD-dependent oxidoreductase [bacterium]
MAGRIPCQTGCPVLTDCGKYVQLIRDGRFEEAYLTARSPNPLASICGRICAAPCEDKCRRGKFGAPVSIRALKRFVTERFGVESRAPGTLHELEKGAEEPGNKYAWHLPKLKADAAGSLKGRKVAVIGAGPAGLACAHDLALMGCAVTIFEASGRAGGMAFHGIPEFRLQRGVLDKEIASIEELGVEIKYNSPLTAERGIAALKAEGYEAVFIAVGVQKGRALNCPGSDLDGIVRAIEYLININNGYRVPKAEKVLVLGGGFVAFDAARMALRASAADDAALPESSDMSAALDAARIALRAGAEVTLACLESYAEMPVTRSEQGREEFEQAMEEGIKFLPQRGIKSFEGDGRVAKANLIGVKRTYDDEGRFAPVYDETVSESAEADLVILAIGQQADLSFIADGDGIELTPMRTIKVDPETLATSAPGVFAGGDVAFGPRNLIDAVANGKTAARSIAEYIDKKPRPREFVFRFEKIPTRMYERSAEYDRRKRVPPPSVDIGRRTGISEVETGYDEHTAREQADRCLECHIQTVYDAEKCVLCNRCVDVCPENCLKLVPLEDIKLAPDELEAARRLCGASNGLAASAMIKDDEVCIRCGLCAVRCPTDAMTMEVLYYEQK